jgi:hypothetical protein
LLLNNLFHLFVNGKNNSGESNTKKYEFIPLLI